MRLDLLLEPVSAGLVGAYAIKKVAAGLSRLAGPAMDEIAEGLRQYTRLKIDNVLKVVENANRKTEGLPEGQIPSRVALRLLEEGSYSSDPLVVEYLGGVLASSRTPVGRDDRGNTYVSLVSRLSTYNLRFHYVAYTLFRSYVHEQLNVYDSEALRDSAEIYLAHECYAKSMEFDETEDGPTIFSGSIFELEREGLIGFGGSGSPEYLEEALNRFALRKYKAKYSLPADGMIIWPTVLGMELYMWAAGLGCGGANRFVDPHTADFVIDGIDVPNKTIKIDDVKMPVNNT